MNQAGLMSVDEQNPWPGLVAFDESAERFFNGRSEERAALRRLVTQAPLTVLFGASGLGKTSLLRAGLFPLLRQEHLLPVYVRLDPADTSGALADQLVHALWREIEARHIDAPEPARGESAWEYLHRPGLELWSQENRLLTPVFVVDQFEEVFTLGAAHSDAASRLTVDLADLVENRIPEHISNAALTSDSIAGFAADSQRYKVLLSFREDFLPAVEGLRHSIPSIMRNRLRLLPMSGQQAFEAVHLSASHLVDERIAWRIVSFVAGSDETSPQSLAGASVEPALLSLVCRGLNERRKSQKKPRFDEALLQGTGREIVADFYQGAVADMPPHVRRFIQQELITERGFRKPCDIDDARRVHKVSDAHLRTLVDRRVLRIEPVRGTERVELTHDLLTPVVREHRDRDREQERLERERWARRRLVTIGVVCALVAVAGVAFGIYANDLRAQAERNERSAADSARIAAENEGKAKASAAEAANARDALQKTVEALRAEKVKTDEALGRAQASSEAERAAAVTARRARVDADRAAEEARTAAQRAEVERKLAEDAREAAAKSARTELEAREAADKDRQRAVSAEKEAVDKRAVADRLRNLSVAQQLAARARVLTRDEDLPLASQMAVHAFVRNERDACREELASDALCVSESFDANILPVLQTLLNRLTSRSGRTLFGAGGIVSTIAGGTRLRAMDAGSQTQSSGLELLSARPGGAVFRIVLPPGWKEVGSAGTPMAAASQLTLVDRRVTSVALAPAGTTLAVGGLDGSVDVLLGTGWASRPPKASPVVAMAFSPDARSLVSATQDGLLERQQGSGAPTSARLASAPSSLAVRTLSFVPGGGAVLIGTNLGLFFWDFARDPSLLQPAEKVDVRSIAFARDGRRVAFGDRVGAVRVAGWTGSTLADVTIFDERHASAVNALAFAPGGRWLATAGADGTVRVYPLARSSGALPAVFAEHVGFVESVVFPDDTVVLSGGADATIRKWSTRMDVLVSALCRLIGQENLFPLRPSDQAIMRSVLEDEDSTGNACTLAADLRKAQAVAAPGR